MARNRSLFITDALAIVIVSVSVSGCVDDPGPLAMSTTETGVPMTTETSGTGTGETDNRETDDTTNPPDLSGGWETESTTSEPPCGGGEGCNEIDLLFVVDNSGTMAQAQADLAASFPLLYEQLLALEDEDGDPLDPDVNIMFTTTDLDHPLCTPLQPDGYEPLLGAPQEVACVERLDDFTGVGVDPASMPEACTASCPVPVAPAHPFVHFEGLDASVTNVPGNNVVNALGCIGPQGINGCGYEAPLEAMLQAINPVAAWNNGNYPFVRDEAILAVVLLTDEADCSVRPPDGYAFFTDPEQTTYWEVDPETDTKTAATSAVCWNAGVDCGAPNNEGVYDDCTSIDTGVLHPLGRYLTYLDDELRQNQGKSVVMLGILGVPPVTEHSDQLPFEPTAGGVTDLVYRQWLEADILPGDEGTPQTKEWEFGIGPGCNGKDGMGGLEGQALPPVRIKEVCEALDGDPGDAARCCLESICDDDYSGAITCLTGMLQAVVTPPS